MLDVTNKCTFKVFAEPMIIGIDISNIQSLSIMSGLSSIFSMTTSLSTSAVNLQDFSIRLILAIKYFNQELIFKLVLDFLFKSSQYVQKQLKIDNDEVYKNSFLFHIFAILESLSVNCLFLRSGKKWFI